MHNSKCGRFLFDIYFDPIDEFCLDFLPIKFGHVRAERRRNFANRDQAIRAMRLLAEEHFCDAESECIGR